MTGPLKFKPILKEKIWGGDRLGQMFGKGIPAGAKIGESWELSDRPEDTSLIAEGPMEGETLRDLVKFRAGDLFGSGPGPLNNGRFPLLVKFIDASDKLSVQVHPDDAFSAVCGLREPGKSECWYFLEAPPGGVVLGVKPGTTRGEFEDLIKSGRVDERLNYVRPDEGGLVYCPAGTVHAITHPAVIVEIQQNADTTFRLHDWGRMGLDGKPRELHVEKGLGAIRLEPRSDLMPRPVRVSRDPFVWDQMLDCSKFTVSRWNVTAPSSTGAHPNEYEILICIGGKGELKTQNGDKVPVSLGDTILVPACIRTYDLVPDPRMLVLHVVGKV